MIAGALAAELRGMVGREARVFAAAGRVNLIGEHTDYNDGFVLPFAIERTTFVAVAARDDRKLVVRSRSQPGTAEIDLAADGTPRKSWTDYIEGVARALMRRGIPVSGPDILVGSDLPTGAGLSTTAALEISVGLALSTLAGADIDRTELALAGQEAEHQWTGTLCGIMDQMVVARGERDHALLIDCRSLELRAVPLALGDHVILVCDSGVKHELASSDYNQRRRECEQGVELLGAAFPGIRALRDITTTQLASRQSALPDVVRRRCRHVVTENERTTQAAAALAAGDLVTVGRLMNGSHASLRDDYEVSCAELDLLVETAQTQPGVLGARMTGGGFGGCTVNLDCASIEHRAVAAISAAAECREDPRRLVLVGAEVDTVEQGPFFAVLDEAVRRHTGEGAECLELEDRLVREGLDVAAEVCVGACYGVVVLDEQQRAELVGHPAVVVVEANLLRCRARRILAQEEQAVSPRPARIIHPRERPQHEWACRCECGGMWDEVRVAEDRAAAGRHHRERPGCELDVKGAAIRDFDARARRACRARRARSGSTSPAACDPRCLASA